MNVATRPQPKRIPLNLAVCQKLPNSAVRNPVKILVLKPNLNLPRVKYLRMIRLEELRDISSCEGELGVVRPFRFGFFELVIVGHPSRSVTPQPCACRSG